MFKSVHDTDFPRYFFRDIVYMTMTLAMTMK